MIAGRIEERPSLIVPEPVHHRVGHLARAAEPKAVERQLVDRKKAEADRRVILEESRDTAPPVFVRPEHASVTHHRTSEELAISNCQSRQVLDVKGTRGFGNGAQHQAVP